MLLKKDVSPNQIYFNSGSVFLGDAINYAQNIGHECPIRGALILIEIF
jgi:hypothetical protein